MRARIITCLALAAAAAAVAGCGSDSSEPATGDTTAPATTTAAAATTTDTTTTAATTTATPEPAAADLRGLPATDADLIAGYLGWSELTVPSGGSGEGAHPGAKRAFVNPAGSPPYGRGSVVVKEARTSGTVTLIAIMEKTGASSGANGGWRWVEYKRPGAGSAFARVGFPESGCAACHDQAAATDRVFSRP